MSRNKDIEMIHQITGWSYKESRRRYHENGHDLWKTLPFNSDTLNAVMESVATAFRAVAKAAEDLCISFKEAISRIDYQKLADAVQELREKQLQEGDNNEDLSDNSIQE